MVTRREMLLRGAALAGASVLAQAGGSRATAQGHAHDHGGADPAPAQATPSTPSAPGERKPGHYHEVITPSGATLPWKMVDGVKVYHLTAEPVHHEFTKGLWAHCWGYNGRVHGPTLEAVEGDHVRIYVTNKLPAATTIHWHGVLLPNGMDGVGGLTQRSIAPGETFKYEYTFRQHGTLMYHSHHDEMTQMAMGLMGMIVVHPRDPKPDYFVDRDFAIMLSEWRIDPGTERPNPFEMTDFNVLTMNGRVFPGTAPLVARVGDRVRIRLGNLSTMDHHPIHIHGHSFKTVATDGGEIPESARWAETTVLVPVGSTRTIEFVADNPGDWAFHCHMTHHVMNQMGHEFPNMIGLNAEGLDDKIRPLLPGYMTMGQTGMAEHGLHVENGHMPVPRNSIPMVGAKGPFDYITMGGMFSVVKIRENLENYDDPGWYSHPRGTVAGLAADEEIRRDLG